MSLRCTISNIDDSCLAYLTGVIDGMMVCHREIRGSSWIFHCEPAQIAVLIDLHNRDLIRCDISYGRTKDNE